MSLIVASAKIVSAMSPSSLQSQAACHCPYKEEGEDFCGLLQLTQINDLGCLANCDGLCMAFPKYHGEVFANVVRWDGVRTKGGRLTDLRKIRQEQWRWPPPFRRAADSAADYDLHIHDGAVTTRFRLTAVID